MAANLLELLSLPIVTKEGNASEYFEDVWYQLIAAIGGEGSDPGQELIDLAVEQELLKVKRMVRSFRADIENINDMLAQQKRANRALRDELDDVKDMLAAQKRMLRTNEQLINQLTERFDSGA